MMFSKWLSVPQQKGHKDEKSLIMSLSVSLSLSYIHEAHKIPCSHCHFYKVNKWEQIQFYLNIVGFIVDVHIPGLTSLRWFLDAQQDGLGMDSKYCWKKLFQKHNRDNWDTANFWVSNSYISSVINRHSMEGVLTQIIGALTHCPCNFWRGCFRMSST